MTPNRLAYLFLLCLLLLGCTTKGPDIVPVHGTVTFNGGPCPNSGMVLFAPISAAEGMSLRPGSGNFDTDGKFQVTSFERGDGLIPGTYRVRVECWEKLPGDFDPGVSHVPEGFDLGELVIEAGTREAVEIAYDIPPKS